MFENFYVLLPREFRIYDIQCECSLNVDSFNQDKSYVFSRVFSKISSNILERLEK